MSRDIRDLLNMAAPFFADQPDLAAVRQRVRQRRRIRAAGSATVLAGALVLGVTGAPWVGDQLASPSPAGPAADSPTTPDDSPAPSSSQHKWEQVELPEAFEGGGTLRPSGAAVVGDTTVIVGVDGANAQAEADQGPGVWIGTGDDWRRLSLDHIEIGEGIDSDWSVGIRDVTAAPNGDLVAIGHAESPGPPWDYPPLVWRSTDGGETWKRKPFDDWPEAQLYSVTWAGDRYYAVGNVNDGPGIWSSPDGFTWQAHDISETIPDGGFNEIVWEPAHGVFAYGNSTSGGFVLAGPANADPESWETAETPWITGTANADGFLGTALVGDDVDFVTEVHTSPDGLTWTRASLSDLLTGAINVTAPLATRSGEIFLGGSASEDGAIWRVTDDRLEPDAGVFPRYSTVLDMIETPDGPVALGTVIRGNHDVLAIWRPDD